MHKNTQACVGTYVHVLTGFYEGNCDIGRTRPVPLKKHFFTDILPNIPIQAEHGPVQ